MSQYGVSTNNAFALLGDHIEDFEDNIKEEDKKDDGLVQVKRSGQSYFHLSFTYFI